MHVYIFLGLVWFIPPLQGFFPIPGRSPWLGFDYNPPIYLRSVIPAGIRPHPILSQIPPFHRDNNNRPLTVEQIPNLYWQKRKENKNLSSPVRRMETA
jgi:hypothetical protein